MGLFNLDLHKTAIVTAKVIHLLNNLESSVHSYIDIEENKEDFYFLAYVVRVGILDRIEKNQWSLMHPITIPTGLFGVNKTNINQALLLTLGKLKDLVKNHYLISSYIEEILRKDDYFWKIDKMLSSEQKDKLINN